MFDFENLEVYKKAKFFNSNIYRYLQNNKRIDTATRNQLRRASLSIMLNIAEGTSRFSKADKRYFYIVSRGSIFECVAILSFLKEEQILPVENYEEHYLSCETLSKMLFALIRNLE